MRLRVLIVDDEALARKRLRTLLGDFDQPPHELVGEAADASQALDVLRQRPVDVVLLDIHMPGVDGLALAETLRGLSAPPAVVFVTAHAEHALQAFELAAVDYLTKPVRLERLRTALQKAEQYIEYRQRPEPQNGDDVVLIHDRGRLLRVPLAQVLYLKAELKYVTVRTADATLLLDGSLNQLEERFAGRFVRVHRNALVARHALRALERAPDGDDGENWVLRLTGVDDVLQVSRRQLHAVREALGQ